MTQEKWMQFSVGFEDQDRSKLHAYWDRIIESQRWTEGKFTEMFEERWSEHNGLYSAAFAGWSGAALALMEYYKVAGSTVVVPSNTFMATPLATARAGAVVEFVDCNRHDLCISYDDLRRTIEEHNPKAIWVVHIGGHIAFEINEIVRYCKTSNILVFEDCAHAHGAEWKGMKPGQWGDAGVYSFYATKTISTGEGGMLVSHNRDLIEFAKKFRNYGKPDFEVQGLNFRMNEFTAAIGVVQTERLKDIVEFKNEVACKLNETYDSRVRFPEGMTSGYYKYIVFEKIENSTGRVYDTPCHRILRSRVNLPNSDWVAANHWCVPLYYRR
jgi:dTDP-4-amino-4,6-dideoxygalactose transaminase